MYDPSANMAPFSPPISHGPDAAKKQAFVAFLTRYENMSNTLAEQAFRQKRMVEIFTASLSKQEAQHIKDNPKILKAFTLAYELNQQAQQLKSAIKYLKSLG